eukprot:scaffold303978_cov26-Tisochrysis_lutea.AAC.3
MSIPSESLALLGPGSRSRPQSSHEGAQMGEGGQGREPARALATVGLHGVARAHLTVTEDTRGGGGCHRGNTGGKMY